MLKKIFTWIINRIDFTPQRFFKTDVVKKVLVVKLCCIGDIIQATPALKALKSAGKEVHFLCNPWVNDLVDLIPFVDKKIVVDNKKIFSLLSIIMKLRKEKYDLIINFHRNTSSNLFIAFCGGKYRAGFNWQGQGVFLTNRFEFDPALHESLRYLGIVEKLGFTAIDDYTELKRPELAEKTFDIGGSAVKVGMFPGGGKNPGTVMPTKRWPVEAFSELAGMLIKEGKQVYIFGGEIDSDVTGAFLEACPEARLIVTKNLKELAYYIPEMNVFIAGDTGPLHMSAALGVKTIGLFGPSSAELVAPRGRHCYNIWKSTECSPCYEPDTVHYRGFLKCKDNICMKEISVKELKAVVDEMLERRV